MAADLSFPDREPTDEERAAAARRAHVEALQREHDGYVRYGRADRAAVVADEIAKFGAPQEVAVQAPPEAAAESAPRERAVPKRKTTT